MDQIRMFCFPLVLFFMHLLDWIRLHGWFEVEGNNQAKSRDEKENKI